MGPANTEVRPPRVLVLRSGAIGDFVVTLPVLQWLRLAGPGTVVDLACHARVAPLAGGLVSQWREIDSAVFLPLHRETPVGEEAIRGFLGNYDLILSFLGSTTTPAERLRELAGERAVCLDPLPASNTRHVTEFLFDQMRTAGLPAPDPEESCHILPVIEVSAHAREHAGALLDQHGLDRRRALIALHPGSGSSGKNVPAGLLAGVCGWLAESLEEAAVFLVKGEADEGAVADLVEQLRTTVPVVETRELELLAGVLAHCALFVGHDSGISHMAAAVGTPTVAIFVSSDPHAWAPRGRHVAVAESTAKSIRGAVVSLTQR
jgi:heptosyltransferase-3